MGRAYRRRDRVCICLLRERVGIGAACADLAGAVCALVFRLAEVGRGFTKKEAGEAKNAAFCSVMRLGTSREVVWQLRNVSGDAPRFVHRQNVCGSAFALVSRP